MRERGPHAHRRLHSGATATLRRARERRRLRPARSRLVSPGPTRAHRRRELSALSAHCRAARHLRRAPAGTSRMSTVPIFLFILVVFANRYVFGLYLRIVKGRRFDVARDDYEPTVTIVVPLFNEGQLDLRHHRQPRRSSTIRREKLERHRRRRLLHRRQLRVGLPGGARIYPERARAAQPAQHGQAQRHQPRRARVDAEIIVSRRLRRDRRSDARCASWWRASPRRTSPRSAGASTSPTRTTTGSRAADHQVLLRPGASEEPRALDALGDVPVGLPHRVSPPRADRARADPREPQHPRRADQVRRRSLPHAPDRQGRLPHAADAWTRCASPRRRRR